MSLQAHTTTTNPRPTKSTWELSSAWLNPPPGAPFSSPSWKVNVSNQIGDIICKRNLPPRLSSAIKVEQSILTSNNSFQHIQPQYHKHTITWQFCKERVACLALVYFLVKPNQTTARTPTRKPGQTANTKSTKTNTKNAPAGETLGQTANTKNTKTNTKNAQKH